MAAACLELLLRHTAVEAVVTKPAPAHHKGSVPVVDVATAHAIPLLYAQNKKDLNDVITDANFASNYGILIDFGIIVSQQVIDAFSLGIINSHFSLLPRLRGADPITWAIVNGDEKTGVSLMLIDEGMDTGKLLTYRSLHIAQDETTPQLTERLITLSDQLLQEYLPRYLTGEIKPKNQPHPDRATYSRKLTKADGVVDWSEDAAVLARKIRGFQPWPQMRTRFGSVDVIITKAHVSPTETVLSKRCGDGNYLAIDTLKPAGKKEMPVKAFLAGYSSKIV